MEPLGSIGEIRFQENLPHDLSLEDAPLSGCRKVALRLEDGSISHAARGGQPLLEPHSVRGGSSQKKQKDVRYTDACIYSPGILIFKKDIDFPERLPEADWQEVDVITCAAPNLRPIPYNRMNPGSGETIRVSDRELLELHMSRARHILSVAAAHRADILVLGAFGCGVFQNNPRIVAQAYKNILPKFDGQFSKVEFAVYCSPRDTKNYESFRTVLLEK